MKARWTPEQLAEHERQAQVRADKPLSGKFSKKNETFQPVEGVTVGLKIVTKPEKFDWYIGIDPGTNTGVALWSRKQKKFTFVHTYTIFDALKFVERFVDEHHADGGVMVIFEDARKRKTIPTKNGEADVSRLQGAGSVKRDSAIWEEVLTGLSRRFKFCFAWRGVAPNGKTNALAKNKELSSANFGLNYDTSEHARCACGLVWKM